MNKSFNPRLDDLVNVWIRVDRWEQLMPQKAPQEEVNAEFVLRVRRSHITLVLLREHLGDGTKAELEAALDEEDVQLSVIRFAPDGGGDHPAPDVIAETLDPHRSKLLWDDSGELDSDEAWQSLVNTLFGVALAAYERARTKETHAEVR